MKCRNIRGTIECSNVCSAAQTPIDRTFAPKMPTCPSPPRHPGSDFSHRTLAYSLPEFHKLGVIEYMPSLGLAPSTPSKGVCPLAAASLSSSESFAHHGRSSP